MNKINRERLKQKIQQDPITGRIITTLTKYTPELIPDIVNYVENTEYPTVEGLALTLNVYSDTIENWRGISKEVDYLYRRILLKQKDYLLQGTLSGNINVIGGIFQLKANHGLRDNPDTVEDKNITINNISYKSNKTSTKAIKTSKKPSKTVNDTQKGKVPNKPVGH